ncbi:MAG: LysM peptidoglycan-binding domain-containing protein, partial [Hydrogenobaculum sp.]
PPPPPPVSKPIVKPHGVYGYYRVKPCDTLSTISQKIYGTQVYWPSIYDLNRRTIGRDPWILRVGMRLRYLVHLTPAERAKARREFNYWTLKYKDRKRNPLCILHGKPVEAGGHAHHAKKAAKTAKKAHEKAAGKKAKKK